jgi:ACS family hexuronate transporter-like MFS transporter
LWLLLYRPPEQTAMTAEEYALITKDRISSSGSRASWRELLKYRQVWAIVLARFLTDPVWWLYITWLPLYLFHVHGFNLKQIGLFAWVPYVAADAGSLVGGWMSGYLIGLGWTVNKARKAVMIPGVLLMCAGILAAVAQNPAVALGLIAVVLFGFQMWIGNVQTMPSDYFPESVVGSVAGLGGLGAGVGAILFTLSTGWVVDNFSYTPVLIAAGLLPLLGTSILFVLGGQIRRLSFE